jgi:thiol-disulfide isomerase/thioredoxin
MKWWLGILIGVTVAAWLWQRFSGEKINVGSIVNQEGAMAPGFESGGTWLNSEGLTLDRLLSDGKVKVILVDFWTYSCINCQRTIPYLRSWWDKYQDKGLMIVGVHSPEFEFEKKTENLQMAIDKYGVGWPVVQDNDMAIWRAYKNNYWPRKYLINKAGKIVYDHIGEGGYEETERKIQEVIGISQVIEVTEKPKAGRMGGGLTPELYLNRRGQNSGHLGKGQDQVELAGQWDIEEDWAASGKGAALKLEYQAGEVNLVMSGAGEVRYSIDGGEEKKIEVDMDDLYKLWTGELGRHKLEMEFEEGVRLHAFTFGR